MFRREGMGEKMKARNFIASEIRRTRKLIRMAMRRNPTTVSESQRYLQILRREARELRKATKLVLALVIR